MFLNQSAVSEDPACDRHECVEFKVGAHDFVLPRPLGVIWSPRNIVLNGDAAFLAHKALNPIRNKVTV